MTLVAIWRSGLECMVFLAKMVMRSMKTRMASSLAQENFSMRPLVVETFLPHSSEKPSA